MVILLLVLLGAAILSPFYLTFRKKHVKKHGKTFLAVNIVSSFAFCFVMIFAALSGKVLAAPEAEAAAEATVSILSLGNGLGAGIGLIGAGLVTGLSCLGAGIAVSGAASAALGAISEDEKLFGKAFVMVVLAEGIAIYGMLISVLILQKI